MLNAMNLAGCVHVFHLFKSHMEHGKGSNACFGLSNRNPTSGPKSNFLSDI